MNRLSGLAIAASMALLPLVALASAPPGSAATGSDAASAAADGPIDLTVTVPKRARCGYVDSRGEIVVCGADHGDDLKVPGTADEPGSRESLNTGIPAAPYVGGMTDCTKVKCHTIGKAPPQIYIIDVKALPEAPKGSDAEKVAKGEISDR